MTILENRQLDPRLEQGTAAELLPASNGDMVTSHHVARVRRSAVSLIAFSMGASLLGVLNLTQALLAMAVASVLIAVAMNLASSPGHKYGIPASIQLRSSFGIRGMKLPAVLQVVPGIVWYGFQSWLGAMALNAALGLVFSFDNLPLVYVIYTLLQILLALLVEEMPHWLQNLSLVALIAVLTYLFFITLTRYNAQIETALINIRGSWGLPFWGALTAFIGIHSATVISASDHSRLLHKEIGSALRGILNGVAILPLTLLLGLLGMMSAAAADSYELVDVLVLTMGNQFFTLLALLIVAFGLFISNANTFLYPSVAVLDRAFQIPRRIAVLVLGLLSFATLPWLLMPVESTSGLLRFSQAYAGISGAVTAIMVCDFYLLRHQKLNLNRLYDTAGIFKGANPAAVIALLIGSAASILMPQLSWFISIVASTLAYWVLMRILKGAASFREGTILQKE